MSLSVPRKTFRYRHDREPVPAHAQSIKATLDTVSGGLEEAPAVVSQCIADAATAAEQLGGAQGLEDARKIFGEVSK